MSRKHFTAIAASIKHQVDTLRSTYLADDIKFAYAVDVLEITAKNLASDFASFNPNFDRQRFLTACGF